MTPSLVLPDPLVDAAGRPVDAAGWPARRAELRDLYRDHAIGHLPAVDVPVRWAAGAPVEVLDGRATRTRVEGRFAEEIVAVDVVVPTGATSAPCVVALAFGPLDGDEQWPLELIVDRGYALVTACYQDLAPDDPAEHDRRARAGHPLLLPLAERGPRDAGAIAAWAWGLSRLADLAAATPGIDPARLVVLGHSRLGKAALWAGATDERFALCVANASGCGGAAVHRTLEGERLGDMTASFPHWYAPAYAGYSGREESLPVDQHELVALLAPRAIHIGTAIDDAWSDAASELAALVGAASVRRLLGGDGLDAAALPPLDTVIGAGAQSFHVRSGGHDLTAWDWVQYLDSADRLTSGGA